MPGSGRAVRRAARPAVCPGRGAGELRIGPRVHSGIYERSWQFGRATVWVGAVFGAAAVASCLQKSVPGLFPEVATCKLPVTNISPLSRRALIVFDAWVRIYDGRGGRGENHLISRSIVSRRPGLCLLMVSDLSLIRLIALF